MDTEYMCNYILIYFPFHTKGELLYYPVIELNPVFNIDQTYLGK
jgi:hypothetical protein